MEVARFVHTNLVAVDWKSLASFYIKVFGCKPKPPERHLDGPWLDDLTSIRKAHIHGVHLLLPGYDKQGPTLEVFQYSPKRSKKLLAINLPGYAHIAFAVRNVPQMLQKVERNGGSKVGKLISASVEGVGPIEVVYARDPEGNIIELQKWL